MKYIFLFILLFCLIFKSNLEAQEKAKFLSLKSDKVNMRTGPENRYNIKFIYVKKNLPLKILGSFEEWYLAEDPFGEKGWIKKNLFFNSKKQNFVFVSKPEGIFCFEKQSEKSKKRVKIDSFYVLKLNGSCKVDLCPILIKKQKAWCKKNDLWGL